MTGGDRRCVLRSMFLATLILGVALTGFMMYTEGEPGALPLALVLTGAIGTVAAWRMPAGSRE